MDALVAMGAPWPGAIGVSGGGDSVALLHLLATWA
jgi:3'-phosphoadenosine 5'-phosphosulfate sulfotransferase (PAPS reductase)/FAD synthetase